MQLALSAQHPAFDSAVTSKCRPRAVCTNMSLYNIATAMLGVPPVTAGSSGSSQPSMLLQKPSPTPGTAILLIHGFGGGSFAWRHVMQPLATRTGLRVLAFDRPAFGEPTAG